MRLEAEGCFELSRSSRLDPRSWNCIPAKGVSMAKGMKDIMKQAQRMQREMLKAQEDLAKQEFIGEASSGMVTITMNGQMEITNIAIKPEAVDPSDVGMLEDLIMAAIHNAREKAQQSSQEKMSGLTGGLNIPGL